MKESPNDVDRDRMRQYRRDINLYEAAHGINPDADGTAPAGGAIPKEACATEGN